MEQKKFTLGKAARAREAALSLSYMDLASSCYMYVGIYMGGCGGGRMVTGKGP